MAKTKTKKKQPILTLRPNDEQTKKIKSLCEHFDAATSSGAIMLAVEKHEPLAKELDETHKSLKQAEDRIIELETAISDYLNSEKRLRAII